jgi:hypothetical protein
MEVTIMSEIIISEEEMTKIAAATKNEVIDDGGKKHHLALMGTAVVAGSLPVFASLSSHWAAWQSVWMK